MVMEEQPAQITFATIYTTLWYKMNISPNFQKRLSPPVSENANANS